MHCFLKYYNILLVSMIAIECSDLLHLFLTNSDSCHVMICKLQCNASKVQVHIMFVVSLEIVCMSL